MDSKVRAGETWSWQQVRLCYSHLFIYKLVESRHRGETEKSGQYVIHMAFYSPVYNEAISEVEIISFLWWCFPCCTQAKDECCQALSSSCPHGAQQSLFSLSDMSPSHRSSGLWQKQSVSYFFLPFP